MKYLTPILIIACMAVVSCEKDKEADKITAQENTINAYWQTIDTSYKKIVDTELDIYRVILTKGDTTQLVQTGDSIFFFYIGAVLTNTGLSYPSIFDTNITTVADSLKLNSVPRDTCKAVAGKGHFVSGLEKGLLQMCKGQKAQIIFTSRQGYGKNTISIIPPYSPIIYEVTMVDVKKQ